MKPTEIRLVGVDLTEEKSFFHDFPEYKMIVSYMNEIKEEKGKKLSNWNKEQIHSTACPSKTEYGEIATVIEFLSELRKELEEENIKLYVSSKKSRLYKDGILEFKGIME
jgi:hypothetical protein